MKYIIHKPEDIFDAPYWVPASEYDGGMDYLDGRIIDVTDTDLIHNLVGPHDNGMYYLLVIVSNPDPMDYSDWNVSVDWLEPLEEDILAPYRRYMEEYHRV